MPGAVRSLAKQAAEKAAVGTGLCALVRRSRWDATLVLAYHDVVPDDAAPAGDTSLHLPRARFADQLDMLVEHYQVVALEELGSPRPEGSPPRAVITLDDAYRGAVTAGVEELVDRGLPATIFAAPDLLGGQTLWWDVLAPRGGSLHPRLREHLLDELEGRQQAIFGWSGRQGRRSDTMPSHATTASEVELVEASGQPGITVGSHSCSHPNLARLDREEITAELRRARDRLRSMVGDSWIPWLAYPYGRTSEAVRRAAEHTGHVGALLVEGGLARGSLEDPDARFAVPRVNVPAGASREGFLLRAAGLV